MYQRALSARRAAVQSAGRQQHACSSPTPAVSLARSCGGGVGGTGDPWCGARGRVFEHACGNAIIRTGVATTRAEAQGRLLFVLPTPRTQPHVCRATPRRRRGKNDGRRQPRSPHLFASARVAHLRRDRSAAGLALYPPDCRAVGADARDNGRWRSGRGGRRRAAPRRHLPFPRLARRRHDGSRSERTPACAPGSGCRTERSRRSGAVEHGGARRFPRGRAEPHPPRGRP